MSSLAEASLAIVERLVALDQETYLALRPELDALTAATTSLSETWLQWRRDSLVGGNADLDCERELMGLATGAAAASLDDTTTMHDVLTELMVSTNQRLFTEPTYGSRMALSSVLLLLRAVTVIAALRRRVADEIGEAHTEGPFTDTELTTVLAELARMREDSYRRD
jgi:hypothetical protein